jgi:hypothetical protein
MDNPKISSRSLLERGSIRAAVIGLAVLMVLVIVWPTNAWGINRESIGDGYDTDSGSSQLLDQRYPPPIHVKEIVEVTLEISTHEELSAVQDLGHACEALGPCDLSLTHAQRSEIKTLQITHTVKTEAGVSSIETED